MTGYDSDFSFAKYAALLEVLGARYRLLPLRAARDGIRKGEPVCYLRHDLDVSLEAAIPMALLEAEAGLSATYMVIPTSPLYDACGAQGRAHIRRLVELGHEVALHFDPSTTRGLSDPDDGADMSAAIEVQCALLADVTGAAVESVSFHRATPAVLRGADRLRGRINAYGATLMECYRSDSKGSWRQGDPVAEFAQMPAAPVAQILTHPIWWGDRHAPASMRLEELFWRCTAGMTMEERKRFDAHLAETLPGAFRAGRLVAAAPAGNTED